MLQRFGHGAAALSVSSECVEVILFGGKKEIVRSDWADTVVLRFGRSYKMYIIIYTFTCVLTVLFSYELFAHIPHTELMLHIIIHVLSEVWYTYQVTGIENIYYFNDPYQHGRYILHNLRILSGMYQWMCWDITEAIIEVEI